MDYRVARILRILIYILVALVIIALLVVAYNALRNVFKGATTTDTGQTTQVVSLNDYKTNGSSMRFIMDGPIEAPETHETTIITVSASQSVLEVVKGYTQAPVLSQAFANNQASYNAFIDALNTAGFTSTRESSTTNRGGACPLGNRYSYQIVLGGVLKQDTWSASCGARQGTFGGSVNTTQQLFRAQIPNYSNLVSSVQ